MPGAVLDINSDAVVVFANKLEKLSSTAFPNVVRKTLNDTALDVKKFTLPKSAAQSFETRQPNFFRSQSRVIFASGRSVNSMAATVGMMDSGLRGGSTNYAVKNLQKQEHGGSIGGRSLIPTDAARVTGSRKRKVKAKNRIGRITKIVRAKENTRGAWIKAAVAAGEGGLIHGSFSSVVWRIKRIVRGSGGIRVKVEPVYSFEKGRSVNVNATGFSERAAFWSAKKLPVTFVKLAQKRFQRELK